VREIIPSQITAGLSFQARAQLADYPVGVWTLRLLLRGAVAVDVDATVDGSDHVFSVAAGVTATWTAGEYAFAVRATNGTDVVEVEAGRVRVLADLANASAGFDPRSQNRIALDAIEAVIAKRATLDQDRYRINNRELYRTPIAELLRLRKHYKVECQREEGKAAGKGRIGSVQVVMGSGR
jgi:ferric-dicitrate binding protein FerR (iron transport regulator)